MGKEDRPTREGFEVEEGQEVVRNTIVGGRPRARRKRKITIPIGIEKLLARAAGDSIFRQALTQDRYVAVTAAGFSLGVSERAILESVSDGVLDTLISRIDLKRHAKRRFMKGVAAAAFATVAMTTNVACVEDENSVVKGIIPDDVQESIIVPEVLVDVGDMADLPPEIYTPEIFPDAGVDIQDVQPDIPDLYPEVGSDPGDPELQPDVPEVFPDAGVDIQDVSPEIPAEVMEVDGEGPQVGGITPEIDEE
jgi:hypothetical protein